MYSPHRNSNLCIEKEQEKMMTFAVCGLLACEIIKITAVAVAVYKIKKFITEIKDEEPQL